MAMRLSGLQRDVLTLYKALLKSAINKQASQDGARRSGALYQLVSKEFRAKASSVARNDYRTIEHLLRYGYKQKKLIEMPGFTGATAINK